jgi:hypothetical protein
MTFPFNDAQWHEGQWQSLLAGMIEQGLVSWKEIASLTLGHINPSQVGTSLASSEGFKLRYGKGNVLQTVMPWFYMQDGRCRDCGTRLELQADHNIPREQYQNPFDADFIENMVLRCRRCNVIKRPSHEFGGQTYLTTESALMWILFSFRPRTLSDYIRMCRIYGMTMSDIRMQEGWAMSHWLQHSSFTRYEIDTPNRPCTILQWPDGGITRAWTGDLVPNATMSKVWFDSVPSQGHIVIVASQLIESGAVRFQALRLRIDNIPFSHYFPEQGPEALALSYTPPKRASSEDPVDVSVQNPEANDVERDLDIIAESAAETELPNVAPMWWHSNPNVRLLAPRGMMVHTAYSLPPDATAEITWEFKGRTREASLLSNARSRKLLDCQPEQSGAIVFSISE